MRALACRRLAIAALAGLALARASGASAAQIVKFDSVAARPQPGEAPRDDAASPRRQIGVQGYLTRPNGHGPFPAVVLLHSCLGLPANRRSIAEAVASWGYVALFVDDFTTRGLTQTCAVDFSEGVTDAFGAMRYLSRLRYVDPTRIAAVGYSQGADTALTIAAHRFVAAFTPSDGLQFKVAAAFYPPCQNMAGATLETPTLILIGQLDEVTPAADCQRLAAQQPGEGARVKLVVYPGAAHGFDNPGFAGGKRLFGMTLKYDAAAAERSAGELRDFLAKNLAR